MQEWRQIDEFPGYVVSESGAIFNDVQRCRMKERVNNQGVVMVGFRQDGRQHMRSVAKLVAEAFVDRENPQFNTVIHLNGDKADCRSFNLKWRTRPFAIHYNRMFDDAPLRLSVHIPATGETFYSLREACTKYGWVEKMAYRCINNQEPIFPYGWILEPGPY